MIAGIGVDILALERLEPLRGRWDDAFFRKTFTEAERAEAAGRRDPIAYFAGRFAAKEAVFKALRVDGNAVAHLSDIEVLAHPDGYLDVRLHGKAAGLAGAGAAVHVSISHEADVAIAYALIET